MRVRRYGKSGPQVIVLHGGPGAAGYMAPVARGLADSFRVLEPFQRGSGAEPLTVARHVADLHELVQSCGAGGGSLRPALVGHSWGAMLALAYAVAHPDACGPLVLIGCGTFDPAARERMRAIMAERMDDAMRRRMEGLAEQFSDPDALMRARGALVEQLYSYDLATPGEESGECDARAHDETWQDMMRLQDAGVYPAAFAAIGTVVLMLHGADDPHPGQMIRSSLARYLPQLEYREWDRCGHSPWLERFAREEFFAVLRGWLTRQTR